MEDGIGTILFLAVWAVFALIDRIRKGLKKRKPESSPVSAPRKQEFPDEEFFLNRYRPGAKATTMTTMAPEPVSTVKADRSPDLPAAVRMPVDAQRAPSRRDLRKAVIWAEILAPPVGLRE